MKKLTNKTLFISTAFLAFFFLSIGIVVTKIKRPMQQPVLNVHIDFQTTQPLLAAASDWDGVRSVATFAKSVSDGIDKIIVDLTNTGLLDRTDVFTNNNGTYKMQFSPNSNVAVLPRGVGSTKTYSHKFILWLSSDNTKVLELFFDSNAERTGGDGAVAVWWPHKFDTTLKTSSGKIECATSVENSNNSMVCSWTQGPFINGGIVDSGQVKVTEDKPAAQISFKAYTRLTTNYCTDTRDYYALAFISKNFAPYYTTAEFSVAGNTPNAATILDARGVLCAADPNPRNYAFFNTNTNPSSTGSDKYFVGDSTSSLPSGDYPSTASVDSLFAQMSSGNPSKASVDSLNGTPINFLDSSTATPGF